MKHCLSFIFSLLSSLFFCSNIINIKDYGAKGDGIFDNSKVFTSIFKNIKKQETYKIIIPEGKFLISEPIILDSFVSIEGLGTDISIIKTNNYTPAFIITDDKMENIYVYNSISNISIYGPDFNKNPFSWKDTSKKHPESIGIKVLGIRNKINNCVIDGFLEAGIALSSSYFNNISSCFIKNNRIGIDINNTSTSTYISHSELRFNSIAINIKKSFSVFVESNIMESNIGNFNDQDKGLAIVLNDSTNCFINNNYFEEHYCNITIDNSKEIIINNNFFAIGKLMPENAKTSQIIFNFKNNSKSNVLNNNTIMTPTPEIKKVEITFDENDFSSNKVSFSDDALNDELIHRWGKSTKKPRIN